MMAVCVVCFRVTEFTGSTRCNECEKPVIEELLKHCQERLSRIESEKGSKIVVLPDYLERKTG